MRPPSATLDAAVRAIGGVSDLDAVLPAFDDAGLARVIALAPGAHHLVRAISALCGDMPYLLNPPTRAGPALHDALARLIGAPAGRMALLAWAKRAPAGWGRAHTAALIDAVQQGMCDPSAAAALIGPGDAAAILLHTASDAAFAIRRWGQADPAAPTAWAGALSPAERLRLLTMVRGFPAIVACCLPWLPPDVAWAASENCYDAIALHAFADASPTARALHAGIVQRLVTDAHPAHLAALTRLACAMRDDDIWRRVQTLIRTSPGNAWRVVAEAPWNDLPQDVRVAILERADRSPVCAAVAAARGRWDASMTDITWEPAVAFFAALDPAVWDALTPDTQRRWRHALWVGGAHLAVRSLGLRPDILARATLDDDLAHAAQRHARDENALQAALFPVALRAIDPVSAYALITALPTPPPDPGAFFCIAGGRGCADLIASARATLRTPGDLALAVAIQISTFSTHLGAIRSRSVVLEHALRERTWDNLSPILALLSEDARAALMPDREALVERLALPAWRDALRRALDRLAALPPEVAILTLVALRRWTPWNAANTAEAIATMLRTHGDVFLSIANALADDLRGAWPPPQDDSVLAHALRALAQDDPLTGIRLAFALRTKDCRAALLALLHAPPAHAGAVWRAIDADARQGIGAVVAVAPPDADPSVIRDPIAALALAAAHSGDADLRAAGVAALTARPALARMAWMTLPSGVQRILGDRPECADLPIAPENPAFRRDLRRRRA